MFFSRQTFKEFSFFFLILVSTFKNVPAQNKAYEDSLISFRERYINTHEVVGKEDRKYIQFFPVDENLRIIASFERINDTKGFDMSTASGVKQKYFHYGLLTFKVHDSLAHLYVYQSASLMKQKKYKDYLFVPFGDATSGFESYGGGRYLDFTVSDIKNKKLLIDFNKAYNPYCAYTTGYNCPIPPKENLLAVAIPAGEKNYGKPVH
ncbi:DUF1684 domain-containing protein [Ginsengibacter hankyongi]|uniref:DUF1684 domain-containing protein n=1 Tax=Ginsengibacter hankyongi TaxID=2607284 RepID=A0A5J5IEV9_9BACT|nr:DUF1684 domain-containing protein [Ginsengibacter hankyongi]KAA9035867.1 DUF1684 domain-containing protein [Ginsengibacter hankyongi]